MEIKEIRSKLKPYAYPDNKKVIRQILNTFLVHVVLLTILMFLANKGIPYLYLLPLTVVTALFMIRVFILFHDCTHGSFVKTSKWNAILGNIFSFFVFTPFVSWKNEHNLHHSTVGNLDKRGVGDIWTLTVEEFVSASTLKRLRYNIYRNPVFLFVVAPVFLFVILNRFPKRHANKKEIYSTLLTNLGILLIGILYSTLFSIQVYLVYQISVVGIATSIGVWLFYIQHQFEDVYWDESEEWGVSEAAIHGSSFYKLPLVLEWISGYIGYHHIHHLNARIPNYHLKASFKELENMDGIHTVTLWQSFKYVSFKFYDEKTKKLITKKQLKTILKNSPKRKAA